MSSPYSILDKRPIDQWKVTELKDELKKRKLVTKGLKEDLIKRLEEALQNEVEMAKEDLNKGFVCEPQLEDDAMDEGTEPNVSETAKDLVDSVDEKYEKVGDDMIKVDTKDLLGVGNVEPKEVLGDISRTEEVLIQETTGETITTVSKVQDTQINNTQKQNENLLKQLQDDGCKDPVENVDSKITYLDAMPDSCFPSIQVSKISPVLGFQVTSDPISTDSMPINEKNEIKENVIVDNVKLELGVVKEEILETSPGNAAPNGGQSLPKSDEAPNEMLSVREKVGVNVLNSDMSNGSDIVDIVQSEKLSLGRSSSDNSMEDVVEDKQTYLKHKTDEGHDKNMKTDILVLKEEAPVADSCDDLFPETKNIHPEKKTSFAPTEKRKLPDEEALGNNEPSKRQCKWNSQSVKVTVPQSSGVILSTAPKATILTNSFKQNLSRSDSSISETALKERVVPPSVRSPTTSLRIDRFVRPFTLKAVEELLGKTGNIVSFWMDHIKTHCFITYSSVKEAIETRNAVYNLQWPTNGGLCLIAEFVDPQEVKMRVEPPQGQPSPRSPVLRPLLSTLHSLSNPHPVRDRLSHPVPSSLPPPPSLSNQHPVRKRLTHPPPPSSGYPLPSLSNPHPVRDRLTLPPRASMAPPPPSMAPPPPSMAPPPPSMAPPPPSMAPPPPSMAPQPPSMAPQPPSMAPQPPSMAPPPFHSNPLPFRDRPTLPPPLSFSPPPVSNWHPVKETLTLPPPPPLPKNVIPKVLTLDDLFCKTKATPRIYYLPLSEGQVAAKVASQSHSHK